jgi:hypothetical protein
MLGPFGVVGVMPEFRGPRKEENIRSHFPEVAIQIRQQIKPARIRAAVPSVNKDNENFRRSGAFRRVSGTESASIFYFGRLLYPFNSFFKIHDTLF